MTAATSAPRSFLQRILRIRIGAEKGGSETEQDAGDDGDCQSEEQT
jgi:hypothetical protein